jgi:hypothetical protein
MSAAQELYREKAAEMRAQAQRAETDFLRAMYQSIADDWSLHADDMEVDTLVPAVKTADWGRIRN